MATDTLPEPILTPPVPMPVQTADVHGTLADVIAKLYDLEVRLGALEGGAAPPVITPVP